MTTNRSAAAATIFSRAWAPPPPFTSQPDGRDLVGAVDGNVEAIESVELLHLDPELARRPARGGARSRHTKGFKPAVGQGRQQVGHGRAGAQPDARAVLDEHGRRLGREPLLGLL